MLVVLGSSETVFPFANVYFWKEYHRIESLSLTEDKPEHHSILSYNPL